MVSGLFVLIRVNSWFICILSLSPSVVTAESGEGTESDVAPQSFRHSFSRDSFGTRHSEFVTSTL